MDRIMDKKQPHPLFKLATEFKAMVIDYIDQRYGAGAAVPAEAVTAAE